eukprot:gene14174-15653_t
MIFKKYLSSLAISNFVPRASANAVSHQDVEILKEFVDKSRRLFVVTGAGVSTESGIRDYRSEGIGLYSVSKHRPILYNDFINKPDRRLRYWARNFAGWPIFSSKQPNKTHAAFAELEQNGKIHWLVTQNVDGLHQKAGSTRVTELHGTSSRVQCLSCKHDICRHELQSKLEKLNSSWGGIVRGQDAPDGDIMLDDQLIESFQMLNCERCDGILKPKIVFFGDNVPASVKGFINKRLAESDAMLLVGSSTETFSSYRIALAAKEQKKPFGIVNIGKTRSDPLADFKISAVSGDIMPLLLQN